MASGYAPNGEPRASNGAVLHYGFYGILAAGGSESAARRKEWRNALLIESDGQYEQCGKNLFHTLSTNILVILYHFGEFAESIFEFFFYQSIVAHIVVHIHYGNVHR